MCGIAGMAGTRNEVLLLEMLGLLRHRGPDDSGVYASGGSSAAACVAIGNNRLSILDTSSAGRQPMSNEDQTIWVVHNGEIFNYKQLRSELETAGHRFHSQTDTEILPHLYEEHGPGMVSRLNGMFAFALWDAREKTLFLFRDRFGIKPLYYTQVNGRLYFASEIKALLVCPQIDLQLNLRSLQEYLALLYIPNPHTLFKGVYKLSPGHLLVWKESNARIERYWDLRFGPYRSDSEEDLAVELRDRIELATNRQLVSDVPVGFFLSGGIDSSTLLACAARRHSDLQAFCISFADTEHHLEQSTEDNHFARQVASRFGARLSEIVVEPDVVNLLPKVVWHLDDPVADPAAIATFLISQQAKKEVTVLLSGQGADEILGGYRVHLVHRLSRVLKLLPRFARQESLAKFLRLLYQHAARIPLIRPGLVLASARLLQKVLPTVEWNGPEQYARVRTYLSDAERAQVLSAEVSREGAPAYSDGDFASRFLNCPTTSFIEQMLYVDSKTFLPDLNLAYSDKLSMACSIEVRVPFLDNEVVDFLAEVPPNLKIRGLTQKYLLRRAMKGVLPNSVIHRRKAGFGLPVRSWLRGKLRPMLLDALSEPVIRRRGLFDPGAIQRMIRQNESGECDFTYQLWALLTLEVWLESFIRTRTPAIDSDMLERHQCELPEREHAGLD